ncbi:MORN-repeat protein [Orpheovirus IHUMI-LCC2]|uniref:MORN-repeat protein n=1 Tax=Orpheovirus IHUMI-LCC2 TaxID=2023057 RepID=A0A2I2L4Q4_9VIRU|nr:MORN-repeat protein [Orpheovirus IHUMI-LCC2]SNW62504.1 MORN-repeat protein [Orpheovirus IHUMI-LCC2]
MNILGLTTDILFYNICYSSYEVAKLFSMVSNKFNKVSKGCNGEKRNIKEYFLEYKIIVDNFGNREEYWVDKVTEEKEGKYTRYDNDGFKRRECYYKNGKLEGLDIIWNSAKTCKELIPYKNGVIEGKYTTIYFKNWMEEIREEGNYINNKKEGNYVKFDIDDNMIEEGSYKNNRMQTCIIYGKNANMKRRYIYNYVENGKEAKLEEWRDEGQKFSEIYYLNDELNGKYILYWNNGKKKKECHFQNGFMIGDYTEWDENGNMIFYTNYK